MNKELKWFRCKPFVLDGGQNNCTSNLVFRILCGSRRKRSRMFFLLLVNASRVFNGVQTQSMKKRWDFALKSKMIWYIFPRLPLNDSELNSKCLLAAADHWAGRTWARILIPRHNRFFVWDIFPELSHASSCYFPIQDFPRWKKTWIIFNCCPWQPNIL